MPRDEEGSYIIPDLINVIAETPESNFIVNGKQVYVVSCKKNNFIPQRGWLLQHLLGKDISLNGIEYTVTGLEMRGAENISDMFGLMVRK